MKHVLIRVSGRVQGVFFRASAKQKADELRIHGCVRNNEDGSVSIEAEGDEESVGQFVEWCRRGPKLSRVDRCDILEGTIQNLKGFLILR